MERSKQNQNKAKKEVERKTFTREFFKVKFPSLERESFRVSVSAVSDGIILWLENKKNKAQWQATLNNIDECGDTYIPEAAVLAFLQKGLEFIDEAVLDEDRKAEKDDPCVDLLMIDGEAILKLVLSISGIWKPEFAFTLLPLALEKVDILNAQLRDALEEIDELRNEIAESVVQRPAYLSLCSQQACGLNQMIVWNGTVPKTITESHFSLAYNNTQVTILESGLYQVYVRVAGQNNGNGNGQSLGLQRNGVDIANCFQADGNNYQNTMQLLEIVELNAKDVLQVRCGANSNSLASTTGTRFSIQFLGN